MRVCVLRALRQDRKYLGASSLGGGGGDSEGGGNKANNSNYYSNDNDRWSNSSNGDKS